MGQNSEFSTSQSWLHYFKQAMTFENWIYKMRNSASLKESAKFVSIRFGKLY